MNTKKRIAYYILDDIQNFIPGFEFDEEEYEIVPNKDTDPSIIKYARDYYNEHLPIPLIPWMRVNEPADNLIYKKGMYRQIDFVLDSLFGNLFYDKKGYMNNPVMVISTHVSKSVTLPVYQYTKMGVTFTLRYNFYNWIISVSSKKPLNIDFLQLFDMEEVIPSIYCEGFPKELVYGSFKQDNRHFTIELSNEYEVWTFVFLIKKYLEKDKR